MHIANIRADAAFKTAVAAGKFPGDAARRRREILEMGLPRHAAVLDPDQWIGAAPTVGTNMTLSFVEGVGDYSQHALRLTVTGAQANAFVHVPMQPIRMVGHRGFPRRVGGQWHLRVKCSDWSRVAEFQIGFTSDDTGANRHDARYVQNSKSVYGCTNPKYAAAWNGKWRTLSRSSADTEQTGTPAPWGKDARYFTPWGLRFRAVTTDDVTWDIDRIYSVEWPVAFVTTILDGWIRNSAQLHLQEFGARNWGMSGSSSTGFSGGQRLSIPEFQLLVRAGYDVFFHNAEIKEDGARQGMLATSTALDLLHAWSHARSVFADRLGVSPESLTFSQFLQNKGLYSGDDMGAMLKKVGVVMSRRAVADAEWGVSEWDSSELLLQQWMPPSLPYGGFYNMFATQTYVGQGPSANYGDPYTGEGLQNTFQQRFGYACSTGNGLMYYHHGVLEDPPYPHSVTPEWFYGFLADADAQVRAGRAAMIGTSDLIALTLNRPGPVFQRRDGEWVYRHDPTRIAF